MNRTLLSLTLLASLLFPSVEGDAASATTAYDPGHTSSYIALSNSNLTTTGLGTSYGITRSVASESSGKYCREITLTNSTDADVGIGIMNASETISGTNQYLGQSANSIGYFGQQGGAVYLNGTTLTTIQTFLSGNVIDECVDLTNRYIWWRVNGGNWNGNASASPGVNTTGAISLATLNAGPYFAALTVGNLTSDSYTTNFGATSYSYAMPSGFTNWYNF